MGDEKLIIISVAVSGIKDHIRFCSLMLLNRNTCSHGVDANRDLTKLGLGRLGLLGVNPEVARARVGGVTCSLVTVS